MSDQFRQHHLLQLLNGFDPERGPFDRWTSLYFRNHRALGAQDRRVIASWAYGLIRWRGLLEAATQGAEWSKLWELYSTKNIQEIRELEGLPAHARASAPEPLFRRLTDAYGEEEAERLCMVSNEEAPTTIRVNPLKGTRMDLLERWKPLFGATPCSLAEWGITLEKREALFNLPEFQEGRFEMQDEGSQLLASLVKVVPGQHVMDFCAGSGGKSLAFAYRMEGKGQLYLHDVREDALMEAKRRLRRAGIQNAQTLSPDDDIHKKLKKKMHWVLVDVPCTGTGTYRRNPDMKWKFSDLAVTELVSKQRVIFEKALSYMRPDGRIVYTTCSLLPEENEKQIEHFERVYGLEKDGEAFKSLPMSKGMDGFYGVVLKRTNVV